MFVQSSLRLSSSIDRFRRKPTMSRAGSPEVRLVGEARKAYGERAYGDSVTALETLAGGASVNERKRQLNLCLVRTADDHWADLHTYALMIRQCQNEVLTSNDPYMLYNLALINTHGGQYKSAIGLIRTLLAMSDPPTPILKLAYLLAMQIWNMLSQPDQCLAYVERMKRDGRIWKGAFTNDDLKLSSMAQEIMEMYSLVACLIKKLCTEFDSYERLMPQGQQWEPKNLLCRAHRMMLSADALSGSEPDAAAKNALSLILQAQRQWSTNWQVLDRGDPKLFIQNALGCVYAARFRKPNLAFGYFCSALEAASADSKVSLCSVPVPYRYGLLYNLGLSLLSACKCPQSAFDCFLTVLQVYPNNPRLWLRLAECCIAVHKTTNKASFDLVERTREVIHKVIGTGPHRKAYFRTSFGLNDQNADGAVPDADDKSTTTASDNVDVDDVGAEGGGGAIPVASLAFASLCLRNAVALLPAVSAEMLQTAAERLRKRDTSPSYIETNSSPMFAALPGPPMGVSEVHRLRCSVLCASAYVCLCRDETQFALRYADTLLQQKHLSDHHRLLATLYKAEAFIVMDRVDEALQLLDPLEISLALSSLWPKLEATYSGYSGYYPNSVPSAKAVITYNRALAYTVQRQYDRAVACLQEMKASDMPRPVEGMILTVFLNLKLGSTENARNIIMNNL